MTTLTIAAVLLVPFLGAVAIGCTLTLISDTLERWWTQ